MAEYRFDCRKCTNTAYSQRFDADYCPYIAQGASPIEVHDMGGTKNGDYLTCGRFTTEPQQVAMYDLMEGLR